MFPELKIVPRPVSGLPLISGERLDDCCALFNTKHIGKRKKRLKREGRNSVLRNACLSAVPDKQRNLMSVLPIVEAPVNASAFCYRRVIT